MVHVKSEKSNAVRKFLIFFYSHKKIPQRLSIAKNDNKYNNCYSLYVIPCKYQTGKKDTISFYESVMKQSTKMATIIASLLC